MKRRRTVYTVAVHDLITRGEIARYRFPTLHQALLGRIGLLTRLKGAGILVTAVGRERA
jgi:hypothetical protein